MIVSLNEIEGTVYKAVRGAGLAWGAAEDVALAARWMAARGLPWCRSLGDVLIRRSIFGAPVLEGRSLRTAEPEHPLCPLAAGLIVSDMLDIFGDMTIHNVMAPLWILPFASRHVSDNRSVDADIGGISIHLVSGATRYPAHIAVSETQHEVRLTLHSAVVSDAVLVCGGLDETGPISVEGDDWRILAELEARTYVSASIQSRLAGAGAGLTDND